MSSNLDSIAKRLKEYITESDNKQPKGYDSEATVTKIEGNTAWVHIAGGVEETPVKKTIDVTEGDKVQIRVSDGRAWITGNATAPPTDDTTANSAINKAITASQAASKAQEDAKIASVAAKSAIDSANIAQQSAEEATQHAADALEQARIAEQHADEALGSATTAHVAANSALFGLGTVENVLDTLAWITEHGYYTACTETEVVENKPYFTLQATEIDDPEGNPSTSNYYELVDDIYIKSTDTTVDDSKTYYTVEALTVYNPQGDPSEQGFYELTIDDALSNYVAMHLALTEQGLWLLPNGDPDTPQSKVLLSTMSGNEGLTIFGPDGIPTAQYGSDTIIGKEDGYHLKLTSSGNDARLSFYNDRGKEVAYISGEQLYITKTVVLDEMQLDTKWVWKYDPNDESIYLKWIGE